MTQDSKTIVERLRGGVPSRIERWPGNDGEDIIRDTGAASATMKEAAEEIERLRDALDTIAVSFHGSNPSDAYADAPREAYLETVLMEARRFARAAIFGGDA